MEHAIGEIVTLPDGRKAEVVDGCEECVFNKGLGCSRLEYMELAFCSASYRTDHRRIVYKEIKED